MKHEAQYKTFPPVRKWLTIHKATDTTLHAEFDNSLLGLRWLILCYFPGTHVPAVHRSQKHRYIALAKNAPPAGSGYGNRSRH
ncbi:hypothetical protein RvY_04038 [Ramazzottius varieornatus]|uniref:Uncharacterized protein n=1 Tax=Ramazzottius varieornatus TaxID=947166 RepID=A0A1D1UTM2_RAMVA|nr:hypothetical protein RvY_04038 [Ramazzottius varieornatus]